MLLVIGHLHTIARGAIGHIWIQGVFLHHICLRSGTASHDFIAHLPTNRNDRS
jgi:hypothetical protein